MHHEIIRCIRESVKEFRLPRYHEIPNIGLYLEQTTKYVCECFSPLMKDVLTGSMVSNYVKRGLLSNPVKKQYSREQIAYLLYIAAVKTVLSMEDIKLMIRIQKAAYMPQKAYDYFCLEFENMLEYVFGLKENPDTVGIENTEEKLLLQNTIVAAAHTIYLSKLFAALHEKEAGQNTPSDK